MHDQSLPTTPTTAWRRVGYILLALAALPVVGVLIWQGVTSHGNPDPTVPNTSYFSAILDTSVLVFREGLESILVLAAITAGVSRNQEGRASPFFSAPVLAFLPRWSPGSSCAGSSRTSASISPTSPSRPSPGLSPWSSCSLS
jgi:hypothetical protein